MDDMEKKEVLVDEVGETTINSNEETFNTIEEMSDTRSTEEVIPAPVPFYTESYKKTKTKRTVSLFQLILLSVMSAILGAGVMVSAFVFVLPEVQGSVKSMISEDSLENTTKDAKSADSNKKIEIVSTDSPSVAIAQKAQPSMVGIRTTAKQRDFFFGENENMGEGSGIIIHSDGYIVTNNHVIDAAVGQRSNSIVEGAKVEVILPGQLDKPYTATLVGRDVSTDLAVLKIDAKNLPAAELGDSDDIKIGEIAIAIGNPGGLNFMGSLSQGIISGLNRQFDENNKELSFIQTDASINPGNSGGALMNSKGQVIGVNTLKGKTELGFEGMGFAIPINKVKNITNGLMESGYISRQKPWLGLQANPDFTAEIAKEYNLPEGVYVEEVFFLDPAYKAGVKANDIITKANGKTVKNINELNEQKNKLKPGDEFELTVYREGQYVEITAILGEDKN